MATLSCSEAEWDKIRPSSVKKTGLSEAINKALKAMPGGDPAKLATPADCSKASAALLPLKNVLASALKAVSTAKDDKKDAAGKLKAWQTEAENVHKALTAREISLIEAVLNPAVKKWSGPRADLEKKVQAAIEEIRHADNNIGHAEQMREEATMAMVERAGTLNEKEGWKGTAIDDFRKDQAFASALKTWDEMVEIEVEATKKLEAVKQQSNQIKKLITMMREEIDEAAKQAGDGLQFDSPAIRQFKTFRADAVKFFMESVSEHAAQYATFAFIADAPSSQAVRSKLTGELERRFAKLKKGDADSFFENKLAVYGLNEKRLNKTVQTVQGLGTLGDKIINTLHQQRDPKLLEQLGKISSSVAETNQKLVKARQNMEVIQALSKPVNKDIKESIDSSLGIVAKIAETTQKAFAELS